MQPVPHSTPAEVAAEIKVAKDCRTGLAQILMSRKSSRIYMLSDTLRDVIVTARKASRSRTSDS